ncbi:hypothetical protein [Burkholderia stabilis]|uniref:hypothetical protein n=1 Tax=Burkholderia stabilis TaxID=95485 RepID=UPI001591AA64|nr:hypothetical protein [Burkholderia stabilis]
MEQVHSLPLVAALYIRRAMGLRQLSVLALVQILIKIITPRRPGWVVQLIKVKQESGGNYDELPWANAEDADAENSLVVLFCRDDEFHCVRGVEEHLL